MKTLRAFFVLVILFIGGYFTSEHFYDFVFPPEVIRMPPAPVAQPVEQAASDAEPVASEPKPVASAPVAVASAPAPKLAASAPPPPAPKPVVVAPVPAPAPKLAASAPPAPAPKPVEVAPAPAPAPKPVASEPTVAPAPKPAASEPAIAPAAALVAAPVIAQTAKPAASAPAPAPKPAVPASAPAPMPKPVASEVQPPKQTPAMNKQPEVVLIIRDIKFTGSTQFSEKELSGLVSEFIGKELTVQEAFAIPAKIGNHYKSRNLMAIANLVGAISREGVVTVGIVEMQMTQSQAEKELSTLEKRPAEASSTVAISAVEKIEVGEGAKPEKGALLAPNGVPQPIKESAAEVKPPVKSVPARSAEKAVDDETEFILKHYAKQSRQYEVMVDNYGNASTGSTRVGASFALGGDLFSMVGFKSQGSDYLRMAVRWATGVEGLKVGANVSKLNYDVVNHLQTAIYQSGDAAKKGVELIYQLVNDSSQISSLGLHYVSKSINSIGVNLADSASVTSRVPSIEWKGILREMIPGGAVFTYGASYAHGNVDASGASTMGGLVIPEGVFSKLRFDGTVMQPLSGLGSVLGRLTFQQSDINLDPSERLYLGGPLGVRAYGVGVGVGSEGGLASLEFRQRLDASTTLSEFYDWGTVRQVNDVNPATVLKGYGLSLSQEMGGGVTLKGTWARRAGQMPVPNLPQDSDGQYDRNRFWLSMESRF